MLTIMVEARSRQHEILNRLREAGYLALEIVRPGALTEWVEGMTHDAAIAFESFESVIVALDRHIARQIDSGLTNAALDAAAPSSRNKGEYPALIVSPGMVTREPNR
jgi:hypothetical protein